MLGTTRACSSAIAHGSGPRSRRGTRSVSGQGYTTWEYEWLAVDGAEVTVTVRNTGARPGREVVQVYVGPGRRRDTDRPRRWLAGFASVTAGAGESATVTIDLPERT